MWLNFDDVIQRYRCLVALGRPQEADVEFEDGAAQARAHGYSYIEAVVLRDWNALLRVPNGEGVEGDRQFRDVMAKLGAGNKNKDHLEETIAKMCALT